MNNTSLSTVNEASLSTDVKESSSLRYPLLPILTESPHRLFMPVEMVVQAIQIGAILMLLELFSFALMNGAQYIVPGMGKIVAISALPIGLLIMALWVILRNARISMTESEIVFPLFMAFWLKGRTKRSWNDVAQVDLQVGRTGFNKVRGNILSILFKSGGRVDLEISRMQNRDVTALSGMLQSKLGPEVLTPSVAELVSRNELELSDSNKFVFAKERRKLLDLSIGLSNEVPHANGDSLFDGHFIVDKLLSTGGYRSVYQVSDVKRGQSLRMSEYSLSMLDGETQKRCLDDLMRTAGSFINLQIPDILNLVEVQESNGSFYLFYEPEGKSLREFVNKRVLDEKKTLSLALRLAEAVARTTARDIVIGGIKPDSITYGFNGTTMVSEFGFVDDLISSYSNLVLQDAPYAAPERLAGSATSQSDLYSIGAVMYFSLTGLEPASFGNLSAGLASSKISETTDSLIAKLTNIDPHARGSVGELIESLGGTVSARGGNSLVHDGNVAPRDGNVAAHDGSVAALGSVDSDG